MDKVPLTSTDQTGNGKAWLKVTYDNGSVENLINDNTDTWVSSTFTGDVINGLEHYDNTAEGAYSYTTSTENRGDWEWTVVGNSILSANKKSIGWRQFQVLSNVPIKKGGSYVFTAKVKGSIASSAGATVFLGRNDALLFTNTQNESNPNTHTLPISTEWQEVTLVFESAIGDETASCMIQPRGYEGILEIKDIKITTSQNTILHSADYSNGDAFTGQSYGGNVHISTSSNGNPVLLCTRSIGSFKILRDANLLADTRYKAKIQICGSVEGNVTLKLGSSEKQIALPVSTDDSFGEVEVIFEVQENDVNGANLILDPGSYAGSIKVKSTTLYQLQYNTEVVERVNFNSESSLPSSVTEEQTKDGLASMKYVDQVGTYFLNVRKAIGQIQILSGLNFKKDATYSLKIGAIASPNAVNNCRLALGGYYDPNFFLEEYTSTIPSSSYNDNITHTFVGTFDKDYTGNRGFCSLQFYYADGFDYIDIGFAELSYQELTGETEIKTETYSGWAVPYGDEYCPSINEDVLVAAPSSEFHAIISSTDNDGNVLSYEKGKKYRITLRLKGTEDGNIYGTVGKMGGERPQKQMPVKSDWTSYTSDAFEFNDNTNGLYSIWSSNYPGDVEIASISLWEEGDGETEEVGSEYTDISADNVGYETYDAATGTYKSGKYRINRYFIALNNQTFNTGTDYYITAKIRGGRASTSGEGTRMLVQNSSLSTPGWGWGDLKMHSITTDWQIITTKITPTENVTGGYVSFSLGDYDEDFDVDWIHVATSQSGVPSLTSSAVSGTNGCNYIEVTVPPHSEQETYYFMIGRNAGDENMPLSFEVLNGETGESLGNYAVGGTVKKEGINVLWEQFLTREETNDDQTVQVGVSVPAGVTKLHLVCTGNLGDNYVFLTSGGKVYDVPVMNMNRVAVYKQRTFKLQDNAGNATWVYPLISRFQIEANGIPGNYPGHYRKSDYQGNYPDTDRDPDAYAAKGETMMDAVNNLTSQYGKWQYPGQLLFDSSNLSYDRWNSSTWKTSDNQRNEGTPYSIDILLPDFYDNKGNSKKSLFDALNEAGLIEDGKIKVMISFERPGESNSPATIDSNESFPTEIRYAGSRDTGLDGSGKSNGYVFMPGDAVWETINLSIPPETETMDVSFSINVDPSWMRVRILCSENKNSTLREYGGREMTLSEIRAYISMPRLDLDRFNYDVLYNDRLDDVNKEAICVVANQNKLVRFSGYKWIGTDGVMSTINNPTLPDGSKWASTDWTSLINSINLSPFENAAIELAKFNRIGEGDYDASDGITPAIKKNKWAGTRQPTYSMTHEILALPGERVDLYPYSDIHASPYYMDHIVRWYDYMTDKIPDYLHFFTDPKSVIKTEDGYLGGKILMDGRFHGAGAVGSVYFSPEDNVNTDGVRLRNEKWVAADFSISVKEGFKDRFVGYLSGNSGDKQFIEPVISFRHIFHIKDGGEFAEEFSGSYQKNYDYVKNNRRYISARANQLFTIRLEHPMPVTNDEVGYDTKSELYYKAADGTYTRVCGYEIRAYRAATFMANVGKITSTNVEPGSVGSVNGGLMFRPYEYSRYANTSSIMTTTIEGTDKWLRNKREFYRAIVCEADNAKVGTYLVRVYGKDKNGRIIKVYDEDSSIDKPLVVAEYEVEFLPSSEASFLPEHRLKGLAPSNRYYSHTEDYLENLFKDNDKVSFRAVNFDKYSKSNMINVVDASEIDKIIYQETEEISVSKMEEGYAYDPDVEGHTTSINIGEQTGNRLKLPIDWSHSNYSFAYDADGDYNMFRLADHSSATVYKSGASRRYNNYADPETGSIQRGTYDRLFYNSEGEKKGMFYYVNAASDPGDMVEINIDTPCPGSTIYVSGWVNEFNDHMPETANVIINYYANVKKKSDPTGQISRKIQVHGFETGYVPDKSASLEDANTDTYGLSQDGNQGVWMHFYYSFVPSAARIKGLLAEYEEVEDYTLVLENNSISSRGADYAIDDIRAYVAPPIVEVDQLDPLCKDADEAINIEVRIPYDALMEAFELDEDRESDQDKTNAIYFAVVDKKKYNDELDRLKADGYYTTDQQAALNKAFAAGVLKYKQIHNQGKEQAWGSVTFNSTYLNNNGFNKANYPMGKAMYHDIVEVDEEGNPIGEEERYISFITSPWVKELVEDNNRDYMVVIAEHVSADEIMEGTTGEELANKLSFGTRCCRQADFSLVPPTDILVDGFLKGKNEEIICCENQHPVVQVILNDKDGNPLSLKMEEGATEAPKVVMDWYLGSLEEFNEEEIVADGMSLWEVVYNFRSDYSEASDYNQPCRGETDENGVLLNPEAKSYTEAMRTYLGNMVDSGKLFLNQSSFVFPELSLKDEDGDPLVDEDGKAITSRKVYVTAIPVDNDQTLLSENGKVICTDPTEVAITVSNDSPSMYNGFKGIEYGDIEDVPLRIGWRQLDSASEEGTIPTSENKTISLLGSERSLVIPLRPQRKATAGVTRFTLVDSDPYCYLAQTNDPQYAEVVEKTKPQVNEASTFAASQVYDSEFGLTLAGEISLDAPIDGECPIVKVTFYNNSIRFKEGYFYTFKFPYQEDYEGLTLPDYLDESSRPCHGETCFTVKVVPEYQVWTGAESLNWNNDKNWRRVSGDRDKDVLPASGGNLSSKTDWKDRYTTGGANNNSFSYAPLDFTKVIIPAGATYPQLAERKHDRTGEGSLTLNNGYKEGGNLKPNSYVWVNAAPNASTAAGNSNVSAVQDATDGRAYHSYHPTEDIQFDMAATTYPQDNNVYCRPWYANACEQIHFDSNAEILNQQYLDYQKAWVDMEMKPYRWYNVALPLQGVVAGDMYLPKADACQATELFTDIKYDKNLNDRFQPAVYQRGWDKGSETVYNLYPDSHVDKTESVAIASNWSHVYNDVAEVYAPGMGLSVKTDVSRYETDESTFEGLVKFRFPKADDSYKYFEDGYAAEGEENGGTINHDNAGKLFSIEDSGTIVTLSKKSDGNLFLVGNPFMAHLDMAKFLQGNNNIEPKFWILSEGEGQVGVVMDRKSEDVMIANMTAGVGAGAETEAGTIKDDYLRLAPMQGFFVQAKTKGKSLSITFTPDMMAVEPYETSNGLLLKAPRPETRGDGEDIIRVSTEESTAIIRLSTAADKGYAASEDVEMIDDSNQRGIRRVYTVAGTMASAINQTPDADGLEVGLMAPTDSVTVVTFNGLALEDYMLYDTATGEKTQLYDGFELEMTGSVSGRYFLTSGVDTVEIEDGAIRIMPVGHEVVVTAPAVCGELTVRVFDTLGHEVAKAEGFEGEARITLDQGIYVVEAVGSDAGRRSVKLSLR